MKHVLFFYEEGAEQPLDLGKTASPVVPRARTCLTTSWPCATALSEMPLAQANMGSSSDEGLYSYVYIKIGWGAGNLKTQ